jgi:hypothetical protein
MIRHAWFFNVSSCTSHNRLVLSLLPVAIQRLSGLKARMLTASSWSDKTTDCFQSGLFDSQAGPILAPVAKQLSGLKANVLTIIMTAPDLGIGLGWLP